MDLSLCLILRARNEELEELSLFNSSIVLLAIRDRQEKRKPGHPSASATRPSLESTMSTLRSPGLLAPLRPVAFRPTLTGGLALSISFYARVSESQPLLKVVRGLSNPPFFCNYLTLFGFGRISNRKDGDQKIRSCHKSVTIRESTRGSLRVPFSKSCG